VADGAYVRLTLDERPQGRVATVTVDRQAKLNVVDSALLQELLAALTPLHDDAALRVLVLTGAGERAFIGGADIGEMAMLDQDGAEAFITRIHDVCASLRALPVPVIARIDGYALGAGLEIAAACDLRVASTRAVLGMPEVQVGLPSVIEAALLPTLVGWGKARELVFTGATVDAAEALRIGLVERVAEPHALDAALAEWIDAICSAGPQAIRRQKALIREWERLPLADAVAAGIRAFRDAYRDDEPRAYLSRFLHRPR
jgi:enoyl-CoA hydratase